MNYIAEYTASVNDVVKSNLRQSPFGIQYTNILTNNGIEYYNRPKMERAYLLKPHYGKIDRQKIKNFAEIEAKSKQFIPGPQYNTTTDWNKVMPTQTGKFLKSHRITLAGEILKNKDKTTPSPGQYESAPWKKINDKIIGNYSLKEDRGSFIEEASIFGTQTPSANYNEVKFDNYKERTRFTKIMAAKKARFEKIEKIDSPAPGSNKIEEAFTKTQWVSKKPAVDKSKNMSFIDNFEKAHQYCPGVGSYQKFEEGFNKISKSPRSLAIKRH